MLDLNLIQSKLISLVGWRKGWGDTTLQPSGSYDPTTTESGLYFQDAHSLLTLQNILQTMPEGWKDGNSSSLSSYLKFLTERSISNLMQNFFRIKSLTQESRGLLENRVFFYGSANRHNPSHVSAGRNYGLVLNPTQGKGIKLVLEKIALQFTPEMVGHDMRLYLGKLGSITPDYELYLAADKFTGNNALQWFAISDFTVTEVVDNPSGHVSNGKLILDCTAGIEWVLYYNIDPILTVGASPLNLGKDWSKAPCSCNPENYRNYTEISKYMHAYPFWTPVSGTSGEGKEGVPCQDLPIQEEMQKVNKDNFGLNVQFSVVCDLTNFIIEQRSMFASALQKQLAADVLRDMAMNADVRVNRNQANIARMELLYEIDGSSEKPSGIKHDLEMTLKALDLDTKDMARVCLQCKNKGVRYGSV